MVGWSPPGWPAEPLFGERSVDLHLGRARDEPLLLASLAVRREVRGLAVEVERGVVLVLLVDEEEIRVFRRPVVAIDQAARLGLADRRRLFLEQRRQRIALALGRADLG